MRFKSVLDPGDRAQGEPGMFDLDELASFSPWGLLLLACNAILLLWFVRLQSFAKESGKNQATKQDVGAITKIVESIKLNNEKELMQLRAQLEQSSELSVHLHKERWALVRDCYRSFSELVHVCDGLLAPQDSPPWDESEWDARFRQHEQVEALVRESTSWSLPLLPEYVSAIALKLHTECHEVVMEAIRRAKGIPPCAPEQQEAMRDAMYASLDQLIKLVRAFVSIEATN